MSDQHSSSVQPDLGVPAARNARIYAGVGLGVTAIVGLFVWDLLGRLLGLPFALLGLVRGISTFPRTGPYQRDRRAAITAIVAALASLALAVSIMLSARSGDDDPIKCGDSQACIQHQQGGR